MTHLDNEHCFVMYASFAVRELISEFSLCYKFIELSVIPYCETTNKNLMPSTIYYKQALSFH